MLGSKFVADKINIVNLATQIAYVNMYVLEYKLIIVLETKPLNV